MRSADKPGQRVSSAHTIRSTTSSSRSSSLIAPPPRAQLGGPASSASSSIHETDNTDAASISSIRTEGGASLREKESLTLLQDKEDQITELKHEMEVLTAEFARQVDRLSQNESETAAFWQAKHSNLNQQYLRTDTELRLMRAEIELREGERQELKEGWEIMKREIRVRDDEIRKLRGDLMGLKKWLSTSTRTDEQESDDLFGSDMAKLGNSLQEWAIQHFRKAKLDLTKTSQTAKSQLSQLVPMYEELSAFAKLPLVQCIISSILIEMVFDSLFVGLRRDQAAQFKQMEEYLASLCGDENANHWRAITLSMLKKESLKLQGNTDEVAEDVISKINRVLLSISDAVGSETRDQALRVLVHSSIELARRLSAQKAVFKVTMPRILPHQKVMFNASEMEDIGGEDEESLAAREICCVTFPGIVKSGDEHGSHPQFRNVVFKARVLCTPE